VKDFNMQIFGNYSPQRAAADRRATAGYAAWRAKDPAVAADGTGEEIAAAKFALGSVEHNLRRVTAALKSVPAGHPSSAKLRDELSACRAELRHRRRFIADLEAKQAEQHRAAGAVESGQRGSSPAVEARSSAPATAVAHQDADPLRQSAHARGVAIATQRVLGVMASEHFIGRATQAAKLLSNLKLSADEIVAMLADMPDHSGAEMLAAIRSQKNPDLGTGGGDAYGEQSPNVAAMWKRAQAQAAAMQS